MPTSSNLFIARLCSVPLHDLRRAGAALAHEASGRVPCTALPTDRLARPGIGRWVMVAVVAGACPSHGLARELQAPHFLPLPSSQGAQLLKWPREQMDKWGPWFLFSLFFGKQLTFAVRA